MSGTAWNAYVNAEYNAKFEGLDENDERRDVIYEEIMKEYEEIIESGVAPVEQVHGSASTRMKAAKTQFTKLVSSFHADYRITLTKLLIHIGPELPQL